MRGYKGDVFPVRFGGASLHTDDPENLVSPNNFILCNNISTDLGSICKERGSRKWNSISVPSGIVKAIDWWPDDITQRMICASFDGKIYRFKSNFDTSLQEVLPAKASDQNKLNTSRFVSFVPCGAEATALPRKLMIMTEGTQVQVIEGDGVKRRAIKKPAFDWTGTNQPFTGLVHGSSFWAIGAGNTVYKSKFDDHEDFQSTGTGASYAKQFLIAPGEGLRVIGAVSSKGKLFFIKEPYGIYFLDDSDPDVTHWQIVKVTSEIGSYFPNSILTIMDDLVVANQLGSITSLKNVFYTSDLKGSDLLHALRCLSSVKTNGSLSQQYTRDAVYYADKKIAYFSYKDPSSTGRKILKIDYSRQTPSATWSDKDNAYSFGLKKDYDGVFRPFYTSTDGHIYEMDRPDYNVGGNYYRSEFRVPPIDCGQSDFTRAEQFKMFEHLEILYIPTGNFPINVDVYVDEQFQDTVTFELQAYSTLNEMLTGNVSSSNTSIKTLDKDDGRISGRTVLSLKNPILGSGRHLTLHVWQEGSGDSFNIVGFNVYYDLGSQQQKTVKVDK